MKWRLLFYPHSRTFSNSGNGSAKRPLLVGGRVGWDEFGQAKNGRLRVGLALNFVNAVPSGLVTVGRLGSWQVHFHFEAVERAAQSNAARNAGGVAMETVFAG